MYVSVVVVFVCERVRSSRAKDVNVFCAGKKVSVFLFRVGSFVQGADNAKKKCPKRPEFSIFRFFTGPGV